MFFCHFVLYFRPISPESLPNLYSAGERGGKKKKKRLLGYLQKGKLAAVEIKQKD